MDNSWAVVGAKCQYIGPAKIFAVMERLWVPTPFSGHDIYTIAEVGTLDYILGVPIYLSFKEILPASRFSITMFRPLNSKDVELFNSLLKVKPADLPLIEAERELERSMIDG